MTLSRRCGFLGRFRHVMHLYGICGRNMLLALYGRACLMLVDKYGCAFSVFSVAALLFLLESCLQMPLCVGLEASLGFAAFGVLRTPLGGGDCDW